MSDSYSSKGLQKLVNRASKDIFFLGHIIARYKSIHRMDDEKLAEYLNCRPTNIRRLILCRMPNDQEERFQIDVQRIADFVHCDADKLMKLIREVNALEVLKKKSDQDFAAEMLMAARDNRDNNTKQNLHDKKETD